EDRHTINGLAGKDEQLSAARHRRIGAAADGRADRQGAGEQSERAAAADGDVGGRAAVADDGSPAADGGAGRPGAGFDHLRADEHGAAAGIAEDVLLAARDLSAEVGAGGVEVLEDFDAADADRRRNGGAAGADEFGAASFERGPARGAARADYLGAGEH